ncbi:hypothetical protein EDB86DRAFT_3081698 [Lactarius hatsudake]|nr:hypothetical protein EDB86DRAFT_3081698 [Lactarius hatsudake]
MEIAQQKDSVERDWSDVNIKDEWGPTMTINFVRIRSPLLTPHDPETVIVSQELSSDPSFPEILWNFSRYNDRARITLEQNPHFYLHCPADESAYSPTFQRRPLQDPSGALDHNGIVYVLFDRPGRVFLTTEHKLRIFGNVWSLNGSLIFRDRFGVLEGEQLVRSSCMRDNLWHREELLLAIHCNNTVVRTSSGLDSSESLSIALHRHTHLQPPRIYKQSGMSHASSYSDITQTSVKDLSPPPPTTERPGYDVLYVTINRLNDDILLDIFNHYRLDEENAWNVRLGWRQLFQTCRRWRHLVYSSAFYLGMHIHCTNGTPIVAMLDHFPPVPLFIDYRYTDVTISEQDELGISHTLRLRDRMHRIDLHLPPSIFPKFLMLMEEPFPTLERLSLSLMVDKITSLTLPKTFLAPYLRHLTLSGICLPKRLRLLSSTASLATLSLMNIAASGYIRPRLLVARLQSLPQLEEFTISFSMPVPRPSAERELLGKQGSPVTLPNLKNLRFQGVGAYLERLLAQVRAPLLERLDITLFNQIAFALPYLSHFTSIIEGFKLPVAEVSFKRDAVSVITDNNTRQYSGRLSLHVMCRQLDWQIDCAAQICNALMPALSDVKELTLEFHDQVMPTEWQNGEIDSTTWHELLRAFIRVKELHISAALSLELSRALQVDEARSDPGLLPDLQNIVSKFKWNRTDNPFGSFVDARRPIPPGTEWLLPPSDRFVKPVVGRPLPLERVEGRPVPPLPLERVARPSIPSLWSGSRIPPSPTLGVSRMSPNPRLPLEWVARTPIPTLPVERVARPPIRQLPVEPPPGRVFQQGRLASRMESSTQTVL